MACAFTANLIQNRLITNFSLKNISVPEIQAWMNVCVHAQKERSVYGPIYILESSCSFVAGKTLASTVFTAEIA